MATGLILLNAALAIGVVLMIAGGITWAIATQHRDHGVASTGTLLNRGMWSQRRPRALRPAYGSRPQPAF